MQFLGVPGGTGWSTARNYRQSLNVESVAPRGYHSLRISAAAPSCHPSEGWTGGRDRTQVLKDTGYRLGQQVAQISRQKFTRTMAIILKGCREHGPFSKDQHRAIWHLEQ